jgi:uncharacterized protein
MVFSWCIEPTAWLYFHPMWTRKTFCQLIQPPVIGMIHLHPLPGSPRYAGKLGAVVNAALADAAALDAAGIRAAMVENFHDSPFWPDRVPPETVASMAVVMNELKRGFKDLLFGVNVLRNDSEAALGLAAATDVAFVRINVHAGAMLTDQGPLLGRAHLTLRRKRELGLDAVGILADVRVKHAASLAQRELTEEAADLRTRAQADALILSGPRTGAPADPAELDLLRQALPDCPLLIGSGIDRRNLAEYRHLADGFIVGSSLKVEGRIDRERASILMAALGDRPGQDSGKDKE